jgi:hypothetical protein
MPLMGEGKKGEGGAGRQGKGTTEGYPLKSRKDDLYLGTSVSCFHREELGFPHACLPGGGRGEMSSSRG